MLFIYTFFLAFPSLTAGENRNPFNSFLSSFLPLFLLLLHGRTSRIAPKSNPIFAIIARPEALSLSPSILSFHTHSSSFSLFLSLRHSRSTLPLSSFSFSPPLLLSLWECVNGGIEDTGQLWRSSYVTHALNLKPMVYCKGLFCECSGG